MTTLRTDLGIALSVMAANFSATDLKTLERDCHVLCQKLRERGRLSTLSASESVLVAAAIDSLLAREIGS